MPASPPPAPRAPEPGDELRPLVDSELNRLLSRGVDLRVGFAPLLVVGATIVVWIDPSAWRRIVVVGVATVAMLGALLSARRVHRAGLSPESVPINFAVMALLQVLMILGTGGIESPVLPVMIPMALAGALLLGRSWSIVIVVGLQELGLLLMVLVATRNWMPPLRLAVFRPEAANGPGELWTEAIVMMGVLVVSSTVGILVRGGFEDILGRALEARNEQLRTWVNYTRELEAMGGEIAHELKNPLASVKGLGALLARDVPEGKAGERLAVMRGEVDRMQAILEEFLTFSRPLSPLSLESVEPEQLCRRVVELHEGIARGRAVSLSVSGEAAALSCDRRKLTSVLVNLVQNALAVAPAGSSVELSCASDAGHVVIEVADRGPGLPAELGDKVFEAGVTGRPDGSGLGLTIALALARQHGGELTLLDRPGGGTIARLRLPTGGLP